MGLLALFNSGFYFSLLSVDARRFIFLVIFFTTAVLPMLTVALLALNPRFDYTMQQPRDRIVPLLATAVYYYLGYILLSRIQLFPVFKLFLIASVLVIVVVSMITLSWKISIHMASMGALTGTLFALSFRSGLNPLFLLLTVVIISGMVGTARLLLNKHNLAQVAAGYIIGFLILYLVVYFI